MKKWWTNRRKTSDFSALVQAQNCLVRAGFTQESALAVINDMQSSGIVLKNARRPK